MSEPADPLDREAVALLRRECTEMGDPELFAKLIELFTGGTPGQLETMRLALESGNAEELARSAHALRGSAATLGVAGVRAICGDLETSADAGDLEASAGHLARLEAEHERAAVALRAELEGEPN